MATPRSLLVDPDHPLCYHLVSRCVRGARLCGIDELSRQDFSHRKDWLIQRLMLLGNSFSVDVYAHAIMSNHFHLVVFFNPLTARSWSDDEVASRWLHAFPTKIRSHDDPQLLLRHKLRLLNDPQRLLRCRNALGSLSAFMQHLKQPIARRANQEQGLGGHFFEQRFYSGALLSDAALLAAMAYVDLNPVRAKIARHIHDCHHTSIAQRLMVLENDPRRLEQALAPLTSGARTHSENNDQARDNALNTETTTLTALPITLRHYLNYLQTLIDADAPTGPHSTQQHRNSSWTRQVAALQKRQRAYGDSDSLNRWLLKRKMRTLEAPFP
jgi:REP element-mobilizing transposase RayT